MRDFPWDDLLHQRLASPFSVPNEDNFDAAYTNGEWKDQNSQQILDNMKILDQESVQKAFGGYYHDENFNEEMLKEKRKVFEQPTQQGRNGAQTTMDANGGSANNNDSSMDSASQVDQSSKFSNYRGNAALLVSSSNNISNANSTNGTGLMKRSNQSH